MNTELQPYLHSKRHARSPARKWIIAALIVAVICGFLDVFANSILFALGSWLVDAGPPQHADLVVVLGGDDTGNRILKSAELVRQGYAPRVLINADEKMFGRWECELAIDFAVSRGYPRDAFDCLHRPAYSTEEEALALIPEMRRMGVRKYLLVTSPYHTARAARIFRRNAKDLEEHTIAAPFDAWANGWWWTSREGRKLWLLEAVKTLANYLGL